MAPPPPPLRVVLKEADTVDELLANPRSVASYDFITDAAFAQFTTENFKEDIREKLETAVRASEAKRPDILKNIGLSPENGGSLIARKVFDVNSSNLILGLASHAAKFNWDGSSKPAWAALQKKVADSKLAAEVARARVMAIDLWGSVLESLGVTADASVATTVLRFVAQQEHMDEAALSAGLDVSAPPPDRADLQNAQEAAQSAEDAAEKSVAQFEKDVVEKLKDAIVRSVAQKQPLRGRIWWTNRGLMRKLGKPLTAGEASSLSVQNQPPPDRCSEMHKVATLQAPDQKANNAVVDTFRSENPDRKLALPTDAAQFIKIKGDKLPEKDEDELQLCMASAALWPQTKTAGGASTRGEALKAQIAAQSAYANQLKPLAEQIRAGDISAVKKWVQKQAANAALAKRN